MILADNAGSYRRAFASHFQSDRKRRTYLSRFVVWIACLFWFEAPVSGFPLDLRARYSHQITWRSRIRYQATPGGEQSDEKLASAGGQTAPSLAESLTNGQQPAKPGGWVNTDQLNQLKEQVDIVSLVESYGLPKFQRRGDNRAVALCPFHDDNNPSLNIEGNRRLYKCFACGAGGDVFRFVKEYNRVLNGEEISFFQAVQHVNRYFTDGTILDVGSSSSGTSYAKRLSQEERNVLQEKKDRIYSMNEAAATFYMENLVLPFAGGARYYLQQRGFRSPAVARAFAVGYAPDVYYGKVMGVSAREQRSLVSHLKDIGFRPDEIVEAGLAVRTKWGKNESQTRNDSDATNQTSSETSSEVSENDYMEVMDRFRGRLVVPILDEKGEHIVAFGGRILPFAQDNDSDFKAPKYLNSPETLVFQKKHILFGNHVAVDQYQRIKAAGKAAAKQNKEPEQSPLILVEGYMDVLALWYVGIRTVVASMGTALTLEQLKLAAKSACSHSDGRVVLCLDNDAAGIAAVERLCTGGIFASASGSNGAQFLVATLPEGVKDPGEFIEMRKGNGVLAANEFRQEIVDKALDWSDWMLNHIVARYDKTSARGSPGSFGDLFKRVSEFLAMSFPNAAERTKSAYQVSGVLASIMASDANATSVSNAARMQLESDLIDATSRIASAKEAMNRRVESITGGSAAESRNVIAAMSRGTAFQNDGIDDAKLSRKALREALRDANPDMPSSAMEQNGRVRTRSSKPRRQMDEFPKRRTFRPVQKQGRAAPLTPHFSGFHFENENDADWLGIPREEWKRNKGNLLLGATQYKNNKLEQIKPVYFNSNEYHGHRFISSDALRAGYTDNTIAKSDIKSIVEKGVASMLVLDSDQRLQSAEDALLRNLVTNYPHTRNAVKSIMDASAFVGPSPHIVWTSSDKNWLFTCLVEENLGQDLTASDRCDPCALRALLSIRDDVPAGAFGEVGDYPSIDDDGCRSGRSDDIAANDIGGSVKNETHGHSSSRKSSRGSLDDYFAPNEFALDDATEVGNDDVKAELAAQEQLMALMAASVAKQVNEIRIELKTVSSVLNRRSEALTGSQTEIDTASALPGPQSTTNEQTSTSLAKTRALLSVLTQTSPSNGVTADSIPSDSEIRTYEGHTKSATTVTHDVNDGGNVELQNSSQRTTRSFQDFQPQERSCLAVADNDGSAPDSCALKTCEAMSNTEITQYCKQLLNDLQEAMERRQSLDVSIRRVSLRLMRYSSARVEGRLSTSLQKEIATKVDAFTAEVMNRKANGATESEAEHDNHSKARKFSNGGAFDHRGGSGGGELSVEEELAQMEADWGEWYSDDYEWTPEQAGQHNAKKQIPHFKNTGNHQVGEDDETLEEALVRIDEEWGEWSD